jgi:diguanylate cyclase (GGDEF)-like protein/PAS domain S-box-containing protein
MNRADIEKRLKKGEEQYNSLFFHSSDAIFVLNRSAYIKKVNPSASTLTGSRDVDLLKKNFKTMIKATTDNHLEECFERALKGVSSTLEVEFIHDYTHKQKVISLIPIQVDLIVEEILIIAEMKNKIATIDELTGLPNRKFLMTKLSTALLQASKHNEKLAVIFIDLDRFKLLNDALGHRLGDRALQMIAARVEQILHGSSATLARVGGDEFVVLIRHLHSLEQASETAGRLLEKIREPLIIEGYEFTLTASIGISIYPDSGVEADTLIKSADAALYRAKANGSDVCELFNKEMRYQLYEKFYVENDLRRALARGEFALFFQPQFHLETNRYCGEEVLVRWFHPFEGVVSPVKFLSIAEETGLIVSIGKWVLREACVQKMELIQMGLPEVPMSVNLSLRQFLQKNIVEMVKEILDESKLPPYLLELEVTESVTIDIDRTIDVLKRLLKLGVRISLDDFGTGYSSLQYVSQLPIEELKIDQSFVQNIGKGKQSEGIISMIINLAKYLDLSVIAEGVETKEQLLFLRKQRCDKVQGYIYSKPLNLQEYKLYLSEFLNKE